jgi:hypothetical protein
MYLPEPVFGLLLSYVTDGDPARRLLTHFDPAQPVRGWKPAWSGGLPSRPVWGGRQLTRPGRDWGAIRRFIDVTVHLYLRDGGGLAPSAKQYFTVACSARDVEPVIRCLEGHWPAPQGVAQPTLGVMPFGRLVYNYGAGEDEVQVVIIDHITASMGAGRPPGWETVFLMEECSATWDPSYACTTIFI